VCPIQTVYKNMTKSLGTTSSYEAIKEGPRPLI
jgi:hypothetical protein